MIHNKLKGFTLIELMIVVVVIGILAGIAFPAYQESVAKSRRAEAAAVLTEAAQRLEVFFSQNGRYCQAPDNCNAIAPVFQTTIPASGAAYYNVELAAGTLQTRAYTLQAIPTGAMQGDACGTLRITQTGATAATGALGTAACWRR